MAEKKKTAAAKSSGAKKETTEKKEPPKGDSVKKFEEVKNRQNRNASVIMFSIGFIMLLMIIIKGSEGWYRMHRFLWGLFGISSVIVPLILMAVAWNISKEKSSEGLTAKIWMGVLFGILGSAFIQIFFVGEIPGEGFKDCISETFRLGAENKGGGIVSLIIAAPMLALFGSFGAKIVIVVTIIACLLIFKDMGINQFFDVAAKPFKFAGKTIEGVQTMIMGGDFYEPFEDEDDEEDEEREKADFEADREAFGFVNGDIPPESDSEHYPEPEIHMTSEAVHIEPVMTEKIVESVTEPKEDENGFSIDIPLPDDPPREVPSEPEPNIPPSEGISDDNLEKLINRAANQKANGEMILDEEREAEKNGVKKPIYILPGLDILTPPDPNSNSIQAAAEMREKADIIVNTLRSFNVEVIIRNIYRGPSITRYEIQPGAGVKVSKIRNLEDDIALNLAAKGVRIEAPVPGKSVIGIEVPNQHKDTVTLREILSATNFINSHSKLAFAVGRDIAGNPIVGDISRMPHVIIAGTTGSGKSVCTRSIIMSILYNATPEEVKFILIDPKIVEFKVFEGIPHLLIPIVTEAKKAAGALNWAVNEMMRRYQAFADIGANDLKTYNQLADEEDDINRMPQIVVFIDELADLMLVAGKEVEDSICRLAQMGRAAGMHLVVATQRPTTDVITGLIKANIPSRIALSVMSQTDSRTIIDQGGADKLLGNGDMLYLPIGSSDPLRVQGCFASNEDISATLRYIKNQVSGEYDSSIIEAVDNYVPQTKNDGGGDTDSGFEAGSDEDYVERAMEVAVQLGQLSTSMLQRKLKLGYARAARIMDELEERGVIGPSEGAKPRKVLMSKMQYDERKLRMMD